MLIGLQTRYIVKQMQDPCKNKDMLRTHVSLCATKSTKVDLENKETDQFLERWFPPCGLFSLSSFLAEFPSGAWRLATSTYLPWLLRPTQEGAQGGASSAIQVGTGGLRRCANSLSWSFIGFPHIPSYSASFSPLIFLLLYSFLISLYICN